MPSLAVAWPTMSVASEARNLPERILNIKGDTGRLREALKGQQGTAKNILVPAESLESYLSHVEQAFQDITVNLMDQRVIKEVRNLRQEIVVQNEAIKRELNTVKVNVQGIVNPSTKGGRVGIASWAYLAAHGGVIPPLLAKSQGSSSLGSHSVSTWELSQDHKVIVKL